MNVALLPPLTSFAGMVTPAARRGMGPRPLEKRLVLLVDDEPPLRKSSAHLLESLGCRVILAEDGREAVERFREHHEELSLVLLDMIMPNMGGRVAFEAMREIDDRVPIILCSAHADASDVRAMLARGLTGILAKPYRFVQLNALLDEIAAVSSS